MLLSESGVSDSGTGENTVAKRKVKDEEERLEMQVTRLPREVETGRDPASGYASSSLLVRGSLRHPHCGVPLARFNVQERRPHILNFRVIGASYLHGASDMFTVATGYY